MRLELRPFSPAPGFPSAGAAPSHSHIAAVKGGTAWRFPVILVRGTLVYFSYIKYMNSFYNNHLLS